MAEEGTFISLVDEDGVEHEFEHLATLEYNDEIYVALEPAEQDSDELLSGEGSLVVLKIVEDEKTGEEMLESIEDDDEYHAVVNRFEELLEDEYEIVDDEEETETSDD